MFFRDEINSLSDEEKFLLKRRFRKDRPIEFFKKEFTYSDLLFMRKPAMKAHLKHMAENDEKKKEMCESIKGKLTI